MRHLLCDGSRVNLAWTPLLTRILFRPRRFELGNLRAHPLFQCLLEFRFVSFESFDGVTRGIEEN